MNEGLLIAWAAGLFEGEGSIHVKADGSFIATELTSTDADVAERFGAVIGIGTVFHRARTASMKPHWKDRWTWRAQGMDAIAALDQLAPYLGERRSARATEAHVRYLAWVDEKTQPRTCPHCLRSFRPKLRGHGRQRYCDRTCRAAAEELRRLQRVAAAR